METQQINAMPEIGAELPRPGVLCTIVKVTGSHPQTVGAKMWVAQNQFFGTLGGGEFEFRVLEYSRDLLRSGAPAEAHLKEYVLCKEMGQCCGGRAQVFFEVMTQKKCVHCFGAGHVGRAVAQVLSQMPLSVTLIDERPEWTTRQDLPQDVRLQCLKPLEYAQGRIWSPEDAICIFTHSHDLDFLLVKYFLGQPIGYVGLIGSDHKAKVFQARLESEPDNGPRFKELWEEKMHCPIGIPLDSKNPKVIAVSIAAELLKEWALK